MVTSEIKASHKTGNIMIHYCSICGSSFIIMKKAEECEQSHKNEVQNTGNNQNSTKNQETPLLQESKSKYVIQVTEAFNKKIHEFSIEANDIREAADLVRRKFSNHYGYTIRSEN